jgi:dUTPase
MLRVKLLDPAARLPVVAHPGEDLGYDLFALEATELAPRATVRVRTGIAVEARHPATGAALGLLVRDRSSMAAKGIATTAGVIDAGYRGEILILMTNLGRRLAQPQGRRENRPDDSRPRPHRNHRGSPLHSKTPHRRKGFGSSGQ